MQHRPRRQAGSELSPGCDHAKESVPGGRFETAPTGPRRGLDQHPAPTWRQWLRDLVVHRRPKYSTVRGDIEGLRAIAVVWVVLFHLQVPGFTGGFAGVDVFFVISGFLITGQLLSTLRRDGSLRLLDFWARRLRRLLPAATLVLVSTLLLGWWLLPRSELRRLAIDGALATVYGLNWGLAARSVDYLAEDATPSPLQHFWSLGVEEQFYLVWPLTILICLLAARRWTRRRLRTIVFGLAAIMILSAGYSIGYTQVAPSRAYFSTFTRLWELAVGGLVAAFAVRRWSFRRQFAKVAAGLGLVAVLATAFVVSTSDPWPGTLAWLPVLGTAAVLVAGTADDRNLVARLLGNPVMRQLGMLSYSIYLWHWPLIAIWTTAHPGAGWLDKSVIALLTVVLSMLTLRYVEDPIRFSAGRLRRPAWMMPAAAGLMLVPLVLSWVIGRAAPRLETVDVLGESTASASAAKPSVRPSESASPAPTATATASVATPTQPQPTPKPVTGDYLGALALVFDSSVIGMPTVRPDVSSASRVTKPIRPDPATAQDDLPAVYGSGCQRSHDTTNPVARDRCIVGDPQGTISVAVVGDSKADQWESAITAIGARHSWRVWTVAKSGCAFSSTRQYPQCNEYNAKLMTALLADPPDLIITSTYAEVQGATGMGMVDLLGQLKAKGSTVVFLADNPTPPTRESVYQCVARTSNPSGCEFPANNGHGTADLEQAARALQMPLVNLNSWICPPGQAKCPVAVGNIFIYRQSSHLTKTYATSMTPLLERAFVEVGVLPSAVLPLQR